MQIHFLLKYAHTDTGDRIMKSLWEADLEIPDCLPLSGDRKTDVLIIGGGLTGILCAYFFHNAGVNYLLIEADRIGNGTSGNTTAKATSQHGLIYGKLVQKYGHDAARLYWQTNEAALKQYDAIAKKLDFDYEVQSNWIYATESVQPLEQEGKILEELGIPFVIQRELPLPMETAGAIGFQNQAQFHPRKLIRELSRGLNICEYTRALAFLKHGVVTDRGIIRASKIIVATHFPILNKHGAYFLKQYQQRSYVLALQNADIIEGMYLDAAENGLSFRRYKDFLLLGGGGHRTGKQSRGWAEPEAFAKKYYPQAKISCRWAAQDCMTLDGMPYIGQYGKHTPNLYVATGYNKWGMSTSMAAAMILTDLIQDRVSDYAHLFSPNRSVRHPQLAINALESTVNLLAPTKPRCPHLGCALKWNKWERSWDCPCHGSRFSEQGHLLDNPATGDFRRKPSGKE